MHPSLNEIAKWYDETHSGSERPKLLSKLALIELCGWIEGQFDKILIAAQAHNLKDENWTTANVLEKTHGFTYNSHFRPMLCKLYGEHIVRKIENDMETDYPAQLDMIKSQLGGLWTIRCSAAHADLPANKFSQVTFQAPSWIVNQHRVLEKNLTRLEKSIQKIVFTI